MDEVDIANDGAERELAAILSARRPKPVKATGACLFCGEPLPGDQRFCDAECRDGWQAEQAARARNGHNGFAC